VLSQALSPILLAIDEADQLLAMSYKNDFFGLIRSWNTRAAHKPVWQKLNVVMVISTHPHLLIDNPRQSPFNAGLILDLEDFTQTQVADLNQRHGQPLAEADIPGAMQLLGGHPYLVRQALYTLVTNHMTWASFAQSATYDHGPFGQHLRYYLDEVAQHPSLVRTLKQVIAQGQSTDEKTLHRLANAGLIKEVGGKYVCRCGLYEAYFKEKL
jgi:hypothetical protein